jgi:hypothetical protein
MGNTRIRRAVDFPVDRKGAREAEEAFFERFSARMNATSGIYDPLTNRTYDCSFRNRVTKAMDERSTEVKALVKRLAEKELMRTYEEMPRNGIVLHEVVHKELLGRPAVRVVVAGAAFSPAEDLVRSGTSKRRITEAEWVRVRDLIVRNDQVFTYLGAFSTTGWDDSVRASLSGPNYLGALIDLREEAWRTWFPPDPRWRGAARIFDLTSDGEKVAAVRRWVKKHTFELIMDELTEETVFDELGYAIPVIRQAFEAIAADDPYVRYDTTTRPHRLVRTYG